MKKILQFIGRNKAYFVISALVLLIFALLVMESRQNANLLVLTLILFTAFFYFYSKNQRLKAYIRNKEEEIVRYQDLLREDHNYIELDDNFKIVGINQKACTFLSLEKHRLLGRSVMDFLKFDDDPKRIFKQISEDGYYKGNVVRADNNQKLSVYVTLRNHSIDHRYNYHLLFKSVPDLENVSNEIKEVLFIDTVTNLPTRLKLFHDIDEHRENSVFPVSTLIYIGIDNFDTLNEFFGVDAGTIILKRVAEWLKNDLPVSQAKLYKIDFSHYAIFIPKFMTKEKLEAYLRRMTNRISKEEFSFQESIFNIEVTAGVARGSENLPKNAYLALKEAEKLKKSYKIYDEKEKHKERFLQNIRINKMLKEALEEQRIEPFFQPIFNIEKNRIEKYESLMRIRRDDNSYVTPGEFLEIAKTSKIYTELSRMMIKKCFQQLQQVRYPITINISVEDILEPRVSQFILRNLKKHKFGEFITFEIVESESINNEIKVTNFIKKVKSFGCQIAIDDFGSGFSNFGQLLSLDADYIKIDGSLIRDITRNKDSEIMTRSIISMAKELNMKTVAEFVSTRAIFEKVKSLGIDYAQGYFIDKADPVILKHISPDGK